MQQKQSHKVIVLGNANVGKTSLISRFHKDQFGSNEMTLGSPLCEKKVLVKDQYVNLQIWDTAGQEKYSAITPMFYKNARAAVIMFDVTDKASQISLKDWVHDMQNFGPKEAYKIIVGNKTDLQTNEIKTEEAQEFAKERNIPMVFTSCKQGEGVKELFQLIAEQIAEFK